MSDNFENNVESNIDVEFVGIRIEVPNNIPMILFKEFDTNRYLAIAIGMPEATSIMTILQNQQLARPLTHDLFNEFLNTVGFEIQNLTITFFDGATFFADVFIKELSTGKDISMSCRPSDGVALAIRNSKPVKFQIDKDLFDENSIELDADSAEDEIEQFKSFLDEISPDDFT
jgi:bifunctional DNase/RNase